MLDKSARSVSARSARRGFSLAEVLMTVAVSMIGMMVAIPNFVGMSAKSDQRTCIAQLHQIDGAKRQYMLDMKLNDGDTVLMWRIAGPDRYIPGPVTGPVCPGGGTYTVGTVGTNPSCSISGHRITD